MTETSDSPSLLEGEAAAGLVPPTDAGVAGVQVVGINLELLTGGMPLKAYIENIEIALIRRALLETNGIVAHAAKRLQIRRTTLAEKMKRYGIHAQRAEKPES